MKISENYGIPASATGFTPKELDRAAEQCGIVMQCTSLGMHGMTVDYEYLDFLEKLPKGAAVADALYNPDPTSFIAKARALGLPNANGSPMLANQMLLMFGNVLRCDRRCQRCPYLL